MEVKIIDYDHLGRGIAKINNKVIFVGKVKKDNTYDIKVTTEKKNYLEGEIINPSKVTYCPYYNLCGSCQIGHLSYDEQLEFKVNLVKNIFSKYTNYNLDDLEIIKTNLYNYRNKVTFHIENDKLGYYEEKTNKLIDINKCKLLDENIQTLASSIKSFIKANFGLNKAVIKCFDSKLMLILEGVIDSKKVSEYFSPLVSSLYYNNVLLSGSKTIETRILDKKFLVRKDSFFQVNKLGVEEIYKEVIEIVKNLNSNVIYDLYCGTGTITLLVSNYAKKVYGIEIVKDAVVDAMENMKLNNIKNTKFYLGSVSNCIKELNDKPDTIIVDPPRSGVDKVTKEEILRLKPKNIVYISCNPITLARDVNDLNDQYDLKSIKLIDEFPNTYHVESVVLLESKNS